MGVDKLLPRSLNVGGISAALTTLVIAFLLLSKANLTLDSLDDPRGRGSLGLAALLCAIAIGVGLAVRFMLAPPAAAGGPATAGTGDNRDRLARYVVIGGTLGIGGTAATLLVALAMSGRDWKEAGENLFNSTLPVFSTWVGTVLAFYFTNESFRQAAQASQALTRPDDGLPVTRPGTMVPFDRIIRLEMKTDMIAGRDPKLAAGDLPLKPFVALFKPPGIVRVVLFDDKKVPVYVLNHDDMPADVKDGDLLKSYLDTGANRAAAGNFAWTAATASLSDVRRLIDLRRVTDVFVTQNGRSDEPTIGWVPDTNVASASIT